jgi:hypothetical protein
LSGLGVVVWVGFFSALVFAFLGAITFVFFYSLSCKLH